MAAPGHRAATLASPVDKSEMGDEAAASDRYQYTASSFIIGFLTAP
ncbi:MAG: hypothetical protein WD073_02015 [Xanthobacteraceae bacterium]